MPLPGTKSEALVDGHQLVTEDFRWTPAAELSAFLPTDFSIDFRCVTCGGHRGWKLVQNDGEFFGRTATAGLAIEWASGRISKSEIDRFALHQLLFQLSSARHERLKRGLKYSLDLLITSDAASHIVDIADPLGQQSESDRQTASRYLARLIKNGRSAARTAGIEMPMTFQLVLAYGIDHEAQKSAAATESADPAECQFVVRTSLFELGPSTERISDEIRTQVTERLKDALRRHLSDSTEDFDRWLFENYDNVVHSISKRKTPIDRDIVRQVLLEEIFDSWCSVGHLTSICIGMVRRAISPAITPEEDSAFTALYDRNPYFGPFSLQLLREQCPMLSPSFTAVLEEPEKASSWVRLQRALEIYSLILLARRATELASKHGAGLQVQLNESEIDSQREAGLMKRAELNSRAPSWPSCRNS